MSNRWFPGVAAAVISTVQNVLIKGYQSEDCVSDMLLKQRQWGARDRKLYASQVYDSIRYILKYLQLSGNNEWNEKSMESALLAKWLSEGDDLVKLESHYTFPDLNEMQNDEKSISYSYPSSFLELLKSETDLDENRFMEVSNTEAKVCLRVNTLKTSIENFHSILEKNGIAFHVSDEIPEAVVLNERISFKHFPGIDRTLFEIQDLSSQMLGRFIEPQTNMRILDVCAGTGGKLLHLAALTSQKASLYASDIIPKKLEILKRRFFNAGVRQLHVLSPLELTIPKYHVFFDLVLVDAPCTGSGTLRHKAEAKYRINSDMLKEKIRIQQQLLNQNVERLKPDGILVYATCSVFKSENEEQVKQFLSGNKFELLDEKIISPFDGFDGFYMAKMKRK